MVVRIGIALLVLGLTFLGFALFGPLDEVSAQTLPPGVTQVGNSSTVGGPGGSSPEFECAEVSTLTGLSLEYYDKSDGEIGTAGDVYGTDTMTSGTWTDLSWTTRDAVTAVLVKADTGFNYYIYDPAASAGTGLASPKDDSLSHVTFCWLGEPDPPQHLCRIPPQHLCRIPPQRLCRIPPQRLCRIPPQHLCRIPPQHLCRW